MTAVSAEKQLAAFVAKFTPEIATLIKGARKKMRALLPHAMELVYDNYNFFVIGYGPSEKASEAIFSLAAYAQGVNLFFAQGARLADPHKLLQGNGKLVRMIKLDGATTLDRPEVRALITSATQGAKVQMKPTGIHRLIIKSVSAKQRPRRPAAAKRNRSKGR